MMIFKRILTVLLICSMLFSFAACGSGEDKKKESSLTEYKEAEEETVQEFETVIKEQKEPEVIKVSDSELYSFVSADKGEAPEFANPLTGLAASKDLSTQRPVAIMVNNIKAAMPQVGISQADIIYECLAEGGITRLLMVSADYEDLSTVGSIRSSRPYYLDFAANHDAVYVHAGGSEDAYSEIRSRDVDNMDGVNGAHAGSIFYRDPDRVATMAYEHTLVSDGERLAKGIDLFGYRDTLSDSFVNPVKLSDWGFKVELNGDAATYIKVPYNTSKSDTQIVEYEYDAAAGKYLRYQHNHEAHIDSATGEQLAFDNILVLNLKHYATGDSYGHRQVTTTGSGSGYYITGGKMIAINWSKESKDGNISFTTADGKALVINRGKTIINIVEDKTFTSLTVN